MVSPVLLGQLSGIQEMLVQLAQSISEQEAYQSPHSKLAPLAWYLGMSAYQETYWIREVMQGDKDMTQRVEHIFSEAATSAQWQMMPPFDHLLNWVLELQEDNLMRLAHPSMLPSHPLLNNDRVVHHIIQKHQKLYEKMLLVLVEKQIKNKPLYLLMNPLKALAPVMFYANVSQGHYKIGAKNHLMAEDCELPNQVVELHNFRIAKEVVSNGEYLTFVQQGGYDNPDYWREKGWIWKTKQRISQPRHWQSNKGGYYGMGLNGAFDLVQSDPVSGVSHYEAEAYVNWLSENMDGCEGASLQHEYQWEIAVRLQEVESFGRVYEWCSNRFALYNGFQPDKDGLSHCSYLDEQQQVLRGACLSTQPALRRPSRRTVASAEDNYLLSGIRVVLPALASSDS